MAGKFKLAFGGLIRSVHQLWLQVTGTFLIGFALAFGYHAFKEYRKYTGSSDNLMWLVMSGGLALLTLSFGLHSFWKARKLR
jgi:uncharacterized membrane protein